MRVRATRRAQPCTYENPRVEVSASNAEQDVQSTLEEVIIDMNGEVQIMFAEPYITVLKS